MLGGSRRVGRVHDDECRPAHASGVWEAIRRAVATRKLRGWERCCFVEMGIVVGGGDCTLVLTLVAWGCQGYLPGTCRPSQPRDMLQRTRPIDPCLRRLPP